MEKLERKFGEIRKYLDIVSHISICMKETLQYENFSCSKDVPDSYDDFYVYGIGLIEELFDDEIDSTLQIFQPCREVMLSETPREI